MRRGGASRVRGRGGFSLVEMLAGVALVAIASSVAVPSASTFLDQYRLMSAANQVGFEISRARMQAIGQNVYMRLRILESKQYIRERSTDGVNYVQDGPTMALPSGVTAYGFATPVFNRSGIATQATTILLWNRRGYKLIQTNVLGRVSITSWAAVG